MGSLGKEEESNKKVAMWVYPKVIGPSPSQRWGHSSCFFHGLLYVFGGCCGGLHYSDVMVLNLDTMVWNTLMTTGKGPGPRDSHSATLWGNKIIVFGGTNGYKKVNDLYILDLGSNEWTEPICFGPTPLARESHTATLIGDEKLVVFGGSGEGVGKYLNDLYILDLKTMRWSCPQVKGDIPPPRDSHVSIAVGNKLFVYGGDRGNCYHGDVDVFDIDTLMWSRFEVQGFSPCRRAGHSVVRMGTEVCIIGGVGDDKYYNDVWMLDTTTLSWSKLDIRGQLPQGRFSHTAVITDSHDIVIYGGCGADERPLAELLILQFGSEHPNGCYSGSIYKYFGKDWNHERRRGGVNRMESGMKAMLLGKDIGAQRKLAHDMDVPHTKRRRFSIANTWERESEQEEHSLSLSQNSSPSQSDQEQTTVHNPTSITLPVSQCLQFPSQKHPNKLSHIRSQSDKSIPEENLPDVCFLGENRPSQKSRHFLPSYRTPRGDKEFLMEGRSSLSQNGNQNLIGAEVQGKVDGSFDSGYLMTAVVNGRIFRGVLFAPGPAGVMYRGNNNTNGHVPVAQPRNSDRSIRMVQPVQCPSLGSSRGFEHERVDRSSQVFPSVKSSDLSMRDRSDLQGVVLTLGGPGSGHA